jgi:hypothetical protein
VLSVRYVLGPEKGTHEQNISAFTIQVWETGYRSICERRSRNGIAGTSRGKHNTGQSHRSSSLSERNAQMRAFQICILVR